MRKVPPHEGSSSRDSARATLERCRGSSRLLKQGRGSDKPTARSGLFLEAQGRQDHASQGWLPAADDRL